DPYLDRASLVGNRRLLHSRLGLGQLEAGQLREPHDIDALEQRADDHRADQGLAEVCTLEVLVGLDEEVEAGVIGMLRGHLAEGLRPDVTAVIQHEAKRWRLVEERRVEADKHVKLTTLKPKPRA